MKHYLSVLLVTTFMHCSVCCFSQTTDTTYVENANNNDDKYTPTDTTINRSIFSHEDDSITAYKIHKDFAYIHYLDSELRKINGLTVDTVGSDVQGKYKKGGSKSDEGITINSDGNFFNNPLVRIFFWILAALFIGFIIYKLFLGEGFFKKKTTEHKPDTTDEQEQKLLDVAGYDALIQQAFKNKNYRLAIRYLYLQTLQKLTERGIINFSFDKTNYEYVREVTGKPYQNDFASLTLSYEYVWYGKFDISEEIYGKLQKDFRSFNQKV